MAKYFSQLYFILMSNHTIDPVKRPNTCRVQEKNSTKRSNALSPSFCESHKDSDAAQYKKKVNSQAPQFVQQKPKSEGQNQPPKNHFKMMKMMIRSELQKLSYLEKLNNIEALIWRCKQLCDKYGYFNLTCMMFNYNPKNDIKFSIWIHPDQRVQKPLHPINKNTEFECELEFIGNLKKIFRQMFPTVDFGKAQTFSNLIYHITNLKKSLLFKDKKNYAFSSQSGDSQSHRSQNILAPDVQKGNISKSGQIPKVQDQSDQQLQIKICEKQNSFKLDRNLKGTTSTLVQSFKSHNSLPEKLKKAALSEKQEPEIPNKNVSSFGPTNSPTYFNSRKNSYQKNVEENNEETQEKCEQKIEQKPRQSIKKSQICRRSRINPLMTASGEIQSDFNNLFGSDDIGDCNYYRQFENSRLPRNSVLSKVVEEFQELLF